MTARVRMLGVPAPLAQLFGRDKERRVLGRALDRLARAGRSWCCRQPCAKRVLERSL